MARIAAPAILMAGKGVVEAAKRKGSGLHRIIVEDRRRRRGERVSRCGRIPPVIVIAKHREFAEPGMEPLQRSNGFVEAVGRRTSCR